MTNSREKNAKTTLSRLTDAAKYAAKKTGITYVSRKTLAEKISRENNTIHVVCSRENMPRKKHTPKGVYASRLLSHPSRGERNTRRCYAARVSLPLPMTKKNFTTPWKAAA